jgi:hypothetical protein
MDSIHLDIMSFMNKWLNGNIVLWQIDIKYIRQFEEIWWLNFEYIKYEASKGSLLFVEKIMI